VAPADAPADAPAGECVDFGGADGAPAADCIVVPAQLWRLLVHAGVRAPAPPAPTAAPSCAVN